MKSCIEMNRPLHAQKYSLSYYFASIVIFVFFAVPSDYYFERISVPHLVSFIPIQYLHIAISVLALIALISSCTLQRFQLDSISLLLFIRVLASVFISLSSSRGIESIGAIAVPLGSLLAYLIGLNSRISSCRQLLVPLGFFCIVVSLQLILTVGSIDQSRFVFENEIVQWIKIPLASSNAIAGYLLPAILFVAFALDASKAVKGIVLLAGFIALGLTTSSFVWVALIASLIIIAAVYNDKNKARNMFLLVTAFCVICAVVFIAVPLLDMQELSHGRINIWAETLSEGLKRPLLGHGVGYFDHEQTHNILIDLFYQNGVVGLVVYLSAVIKVLKTCAIDSSLKPSFAYLVALFLYQCEETCYFDYRGDILFWAFAGFAMALAMHNRSEIANLLNTQKESDVR